MIAEAIAELKDISQQALAPKTPIVTTIKSGDPHKTRLLKIDGTVDEVTDVHPFRKHIVYDIDSLSTWATGEADGATASDDTKNGRHVWHSENEVVLVLDDREYRENLVTMPLPKHPKFLALKDGTNKKFEQRDLIQFLRLNLKEEITNAFPDFIARLRAIKIKKDESGESNIQHGRESMGREVMAEVAGISELPEDITLQVPVWLHHEFVVSIECAFDVNVQDQSFQFRPKPGVIERAMCSAQEWLHTRLGEECGPAVILFGKP